MISEHVKERRFLGYTPLPKGAWAVIDLPCQADLVAEDCTGMGPQVKICGITNPDDALAAIAAGADAVGFVFYERSPRYISVATAAQVIRQLPPGVARVGVWVNADETRIRHAVRTCRLDAVQLHGDEPAAFCLKLDLDGLLSEESLTRFLHEELSPRRHVGIIKAFRIQNADSLRSLSDYPTDAWLLDSYLPGQAGGTGARFNWELACQARQLGRPIILAGGLTPQNVAEAVRQVQPYAVDVSSGVESAPGRKDHRSLCAFIAAAKSEDAGLWPRGGELKAS